MPPKTFQSSLHVTHITTATAILEIDGVNLITDPVFSPAGTKFDVTHLFPDGTEQMFISVDGDPALALNQLPPIDGVLLSHEDHDDNLDPEGRRLLDGRYVITTMDGAKNLAPRPGVAGIKPWETQVYHFRGTEFQITGTPCIHLPGGESTGFLIHTPSFGHTDGLPNVIWFSGDTIYLDEHFKIRESFHVAAAIMNLGAAKVPFPGHDEPLQITMGGEDAARLVREIGIDVVIPIHFESWHHFTQYRKELEEAFEKEGVMDKVCWMTPGEKKRVL